jgi:hypothetical protein
VTRCGARTQITATQAQVVGEGRALRGQHQRGLVDQRRGGFDPLVIAELVR